MRLIKALEIIKPQSIANSIYRDKWQSPAHINYIERKLLDIFQHGNQKLIINLPPRHGKSEFITKIFPFWWLLNRPNNRIIISAYNSHLAELFGRELLGMFKNHAGRYGIELSQSQKSKSEFVTNRNGSVTAVGVGGSLTGKGADLIIVDDPIKNDAEANSATSRDKIYEWFKATLLTRLEPNGSVILVMTRWHEDDLAGRLLKSNKWDRIILPAIAEKNDILGRKIGEPLWAERYNLAKLQDIKEDIGNYWFSGLYQQSPSPSDGGLFKRSCFKYFELENQIAINNDFTIYLEDINTFFACDLAISSSEKADYTVVLIFALDNNKNILIIDVYREKIIPSKHVDIILELYQKHRPSLVGIETVQYQSSLFHTLNDKGLPVVKLVPKKDKVTRALPLAAKLESGKVYFNRSITCISDMENELLNFPNGKHDDIVDTLSYAVEMCSTISETIPISYEKKKQYIMRGY